MWTLLEAEGQTAPQASGFVLSYVVENLREVMEGLREAGVEIDRVQDHSAGRSAWIRDPEGRVIELWED